MKDRQFEDKCNELKQNPAHPYFGADPKQTYPAANQKLVHIQVPEGSYIIPPSVDPGAPPTKYAGTFAENFAKWQETIKSSPVSPDVEKKRQTVDQHVAQLKQYVAHFDTSNGGVCTVIGYFTRKDNLVLSAAVCSPNDQFSKKQGRNNALLRIRTKGHLMKLRYQKDFNGGCSKGKFFNDAAQLVAAIYGDATHLLPSVK